MTENEKEKQKKITIANWKPNESEMLVGNDGGIFLVYFEKVYNNPDIAIFDRFLIKKNSYENFLETISRYINFFENFYDTENELILAYLKLKYVLDYKKMFDENTVSQLIDMIYDVMFTDSMVEKITRMVDDNYNDDIESKDNHNKYRQSSDKKYLESLEFTNDHVKALLKISFGMKIMCPVLFHFVALKVIKIDKDSDFVYQFYKGLFPLFNGESNMYVKLYTYIKAKVMEASSRNPTIFNQRDILGGDVSIVIHQFLRKVLISENMMKYRFMANIVGFNKTVIKYQLGYYIRDQYSKTLTEVVSEKNVDGLSGMDKLSMHQNKIDEGDCVMSDVNVELVIKYIMDRHDFDISEDEINYHLKHFNPSNLQVQMIFSYWSEYFGSYRNVNLITERDFVILALILKRKLLLVSGYDAFTDIDQDACSDAILPYILTGNLGDDKISTRMIRNNKFITKVKESSLYKKLINNKYKNLFIMKPDYLIGILSQFINTQFTYVAYECKELLGKPIVVNEDKLSDELLFFISCI